MTDARPRFEVIPPDWGQAHLTSDAVVAFVDDELSAGAQARAARHLEGCAECAAEVVAQGQARAALRSAHDPALPSSLLRNLRSIPQDTDLPAEPPVRPDPAPPTRTAPLRRRARIGAGAAVSGLALGALAFGVSGLVSAPADPVPAPADRGVLGGPLLGGAPGQVLDARMQLAPAPVPAPQPMRTTVEALLERLDRMPAAFELPGSPP